MRKIKNSLRKFFWLLQFCKCYIICIFCLFQKSQLIIFAFVILFTIKNRYPRRKLITYYSWTGCADAWSSLIYRLVFAARLASVFWRQVILVRHILIVPVKCGNSFFDGNLHFLSPLLITLITMNVSLSFLNLPIVESIQTI